MNTLAGINTRRITEQILEALEWPYFAMLFAQRIETEHGPVHVVSKKFCINIGMRPQQIINAEKTGKIRIVPSVPNEDRQVGAPLPLP